MATHYSIFAWKVPWTEKHGGLTWGHKESDVPKRLSTHLPLEKTKSFYNLNYHAAKSSLF